MRDQSVGTRQRPYRKRKRANQELATRARITEAAVALHQTLGPAHTTIKAVAERAGVQRATVYRHFPDAQALFEACTAHYAERHPWPDPQAWSAIASPDDRLRRALAELYAWYGETEQMLFRAMRDVEAMPTTTQQWMLGYFDGVHAVLMAGRPERGRSRRRISGAIGHAIAFATWRSLIREQALNDEEAVTLMAAMVDAAGD
jgi:AcrR family transcriptional regulator